LINFLQNYHKLLSTHGYKFLFNYLISNFDKWNFSFRSVKLSSYLSIMTINQSISQSVKTHLYSAICCEWIRGANALASLDWKIKLSNL